MPCFATSPPITVHRLASLSGTATPERRPSLPLSIDLPSSVFLTARGFDTNPASPTPPAPVTPTPVHALSVSSGGEDAGPRSDSDGEDDLGGFVVVGGLPSPVVARLHVPVTERDLACTAPGEWLRCVRRDLGDAGLWV